MRISTKNSMMCIVYWVISRVYFFPHSDKCSWVIIWWFPQKISVSLIFSGTVNIRWIFSSCDRSDIKRVSEVTSLGLTSAHKFFRRREISGQREGAEDKVLALHVAGSIQYLAPPMISLNTAGVNIGVIPKLPITSPPKINIMFFLVVVEGVQNCDPQTRREQTVLFQNWMITRNTLEVNF